MPRALGDCSHWCECGGQMLEDEMSISFCQMKCGCGRVIDSRSGDYFELLERSNKAALALKKKQLAETPAEQAGLREVLGRQIGEIEETLAAFPH